MIGKPDDPHSCLGLGISTDVDHIIPKSRGGEDTPENLQGACHSCHSRKTATERTQPIANQPRSSLAHA